MRDKIADMLDSLDGSTWKPPIGRNDVVKVRGSELIDVFPALAAVVRQIKPEM